jgi:hypothetical protein
MACATPEPGRMATAMWAQQNTINTTYGHKETDSDSDDNLLSN